MTDETADAGSVDEGQLVQTPRGWGAGVEISGSRIVFSNLFGIVDFSKMLAQSGLLRGYGIENWETAVSRICTGIELGIGPMMALESIATIHGKSRPYGDLVPYLAERQEGFVDREEWFERDGERLDRYPSGKITEEDRTLTAVCKLTWKTQAGETRTKEIGFSVADAMAARLFPGTDKNGKFAPTAVWNVWTIRMLMWRARTFCVRDVFPGAMKGYRTREEELDIGPREVEADVVETRVEGDIDPDDVQPDGGPPEGGAVPSDASEEEEPKKPDRHEKEEADFDTHRDLVARIRNGQNLGIVLFPPSVTEAKGPIPEASLLSAIGLNPKKFCVVRVDRTAVDGIGVRVLIGILGNPEGRRLASLIIGHFSGEGEPPYPVDPDVLQPIVPAESNLLDEATKPDTGEHCDHTEQMDPGIGGDVGKTEGEEVSERFHRDESEKAPPDEPGGPDDEAIICPVHGSRVVRCCDKWDKATQAERQGLVDAGLAEHVDQVAEARGTPKEFEPVGGPGDLKRMKVADLRARLKSSSATSGLFGAEAKAVYKALFPSTPPSSLTKPELIRLVSLVESGKWKDVL